MHEVQVQETPLLYIGKLVKLCKIPVLGQIQMLLNVSPVQILILHLAKQKAESEALRKELEDNYNRHHEEYAEALFQKMIKG